MSRDIIFPNDAVHNVNVNVKGFVPGKPGKSPYIGDDGYWYIFDEATNSWVNSGVYAKAADDAKADAEAAATQASYYRDIALTAKNEADAFSQDAFLYRTQAVSAKNDAVDAKVAAQSAKTAAETAQGLAEDAVDEASDEADRAEAAADRAESAASMFDDDVQGYVDEWLDEHPEATTTVQDGAITKEKLSDSLKTVKYNILDYAGDTLNEKWGSLKTNFVAWEYKQILIPYPREGCDACIKVGNDWKWKVSAPLIFDDKCNCADIEVHGELYAVAPVDQVLLFDDDAKPENIYFTNGVEIRGNRFGNNTIGCGIEIRAGARINFLGQAIINDCNYGVIVGGDEQSAPVEAFFNNLQIGFFNNNAVYVSGTGHVVNLNCNYVSMACAQNQNLNAIYIGEFTNNIYINQAIYGTDISKDGYTTYDANSVVYIDGGTHDTHNIRIGLILGTNSAYGLYVNGIAGKVIYDVIVDCIALQVNGVAVYARYVREMSIGNIKADNSVDIANCYHSFIASYMRSTDVVDRFVAFATKFRVDTTTAIGSKPDITYTDRGTITEVSTAYGTKVYYNNGNENIPFDGQMFVPDVTTLPAPAWNLRGKMYRLNNDSGQDVIAVCIRYGGNSYRWFDLISNTVI